MQETDSLTAASARPTSFSSPSPPRATSASTSPAIASMPWRIELCTREIIKRSPKQTAGILPGCELSGKQRIPVGAASNGDGRLGAAEAIT